ncbi:glycosyltransferase [Flavobacterium sp. GT3R68]|uniref:glycosyltransferase family 2 protein n=1 Tax=Flavobacterium sp. GT3R68 TaxID=2594437 RepID=UPI000F8818F7|nr:glycosyltransferase [Flavobacterium sp. GT3R68]RTY86478.1 glycosyltransferase [Flavobacterium sp. GSN2]TRW94024.1 glycosyltransferase [Flavobacterium sp. GT3R68]
MEAITILLYLNVLIYILFIIGLIYGFPKVKTFKKSEVHPKTTFSIIIPFRNEEHYLPQLLQSFSHLDYPKNLFEFIFIDDDSEDQSAKVITKWRMEHGLFHTTVLENVRISNSPKKDAISRAIPIIKNQWIITTDADCTVDSNWLLTLDSYIQNHDVSMIAGPVTYNGKRSFLHRFQQMDLMSLQGVTIGSFGLQKSFICNGANFAYTKKLFQELDGFKGNSAIASGDDVFLLQKAAAQFPDKVHYLKSDSAIVRTEPLNNWKSLFHQRVRWASKTTSYQSEYGEILAMAVFFGNLSLLVTLVFCLFHLLPWEHLAILFIVKFTIDMVLLIQTNRFLNKGKFLFPVISSLLYPFFSTSVALYTMFGKYEWKGRKFKL